jgi:hypothetical protein
MFSFLGFDNLFFRPRIMDADTTHNRSDNMSESDDNAKKAGAVGATGTVAGIGVAAAGSSAAAMTGTLATIGCGSMAAGIGVVAAAPLAVGGIVYGLWKWLADD